MTDPRIPEFEAIYQCRLVGVVGPGLGRDGFVLRSNRLTAVKFFDHADRFLREHEVYQILKARDIWQVAGHNTPRLLLANQSLRTIEMTLVERPFILDFAGAMRHEEVPDFPPHVIEEHLQRVQDLFGNRWADALRVADVFRQMTGFTLLDIHPGNIAFPD
ncbi:MAG TPA: hypothetical protein VMD30_14560 [Tepidisphaeraceae bacterium]|nr:hypothetical protein [Tepidisphaeraceae bacterium]